MKRLRVLVLMHPDLMPPDSSKGYTEEQVNVWKTEYDVVTTLRANGHEVKPLGVQDELKPIRDEIESWKPHVVFNLLEQFHGEPAYDQNVASYLELLRIPYTGCNPRGLMLARGKDLSKQLMAYHRIPVPDFAVFPINRKVKRPARLGASADRQERERGRLLGHRAGLGGGQRREAAERVNFIHERIGTPAIAEQFIEGREIYVGVIGNDRLRVLPIWELQFGSMPEGAHRIATERVKHDTRYQDKVGIEHGPAKDLSPELRARHRQPGASGSAAASTSTATPASISGSPPTARRIASRPTPTPKSPRSRNSPRRPSTMACPIPNCSTGWSHWVSAGPRPSPTESDRRRSLWVPRYKMKSLKVSAC